jgi:uncharacterized protein DUF6894
VVHYRFNLVGPGNKAEPVDQPVEDLGDAIARAQRLALDLIKERCDILGTGSAIVVTDDDGKEVHRENIDSADKQA